MRSQKLNGRNPHRRPRPKRGVDLANAYAKLASNKRTGGTTHYHEPEVLRTVPIPRGGTMRLEALRPALSGGEPIIRWVAEYVGPDGAHNTVESYLQIPHHGFEALEQGEAASLIENDCRRILAKIRRERIEGDRPR